MLKCVCSGIGEHVVGWALLDPPWLQELVGTSPLGGEAGKQAQSVAGQWETGSPLICQDLRIS